MQIQTHRPVLEDGLARSMQRSRRHIVGEICSRTVDLIRRPCIRSNKGAAVRGHRHKLTRIVVRVVGGEEGFHSIDFAHGGRGAAKRAARGCVGDGALTVLLQEIAEPPLCFIVFQN